MATGSELAAAQGFYQIASTYYANHDLYILLQLLYNVGR